MGRGRLPGQRSVLKLVLASGRRSFVLVEGVPVVVVELHAFGAEAGSDAVVEATKTVPARRVGVAAGVPGLAEGAVGVVGMPPAVVAVGAEVVDGGVVGEGVGVVMTADATHRAVRGGSWGGVFGGF